MQHVEAANDTALFGIPDAMHVSFESQGYSIRSAHPYNDLLKIESQSANGAYTDTKLTH